MTGPGARAIATVAAIATLAAACTGSDQPEVQPPTESAQPPPTAPATTEPAEATTPDSTEAVEPSTTAVETTPIASSTTSEPAPPTTTLEDLRQQIEADLNEGEQAFIEAGGMPGTPRSRDLISRFETGPSLESTLQLLDELASSRQVLEANPDVASTIVVMEVEPQGPAEAVTTLCRIDAAIVRELDSVGAPGRIVNDLVVRNTTRTVVQFEDDIWKIFDGTQLDREEDEVSCA